MTTSSEKLTFDAESIIDKSILESPFVQERAPRCLRITCYGSSSSKTPESYLKEARHLGYILARRGHTCVNGAGSFGCMAAMNDGAAAGNGHIVGVIHKMWLADQPDGQSATSTEDAAPLQKGRQLPDPGAHSVFDKATTTERRKTLRDGGAHKIFQTNDTTTTASIVESTTGDGGPTREILIAGGRDLQERKRLLVENAHALVVLPGGPGTWDELWEMACARKLGLEHALPIVCVNVNHFYQPFYDIMQRAFEDGLQEQEPHELIHFVDTAEEAVRWVELLQESPDLAPKVVVQKRKSALRKSSFLGGFVGGKKFNWSLPSRSLSWLAGSREGSVLSEEEEESDDHLSATAPATASASTSLSSGILIFGTGLALGFLMNQLRKDKR